MQAQLHTLSDIKTAMESATATLLSQSCGIPNVYTSRSELNKATDSAEVQFQQGAPTGHIFLSGSSYVPILDSWTGRTTVQVITDRSINNASHSIYYSKIQSILSNVDSYNTASILPYHCVARSQFSGMDSAVDPESNLDISQLSFEQIVYIRPAAWQ